MLFQKDTQIEQRGGLNLLFIFSTYITSIYFTQVLTFCLQDGITHAVVSM